MSGTLVREREPSPRHRCEPPCGRWGVSGDGLTRFEPGGRSPIDRPLYALGAVWLCDCGSAWKVVTPRIVGSGQQRVGPEWHQLGRFDSWRWRRRARNALRSSA